MTFYGDMEYWDERYLKSGDVTRFDWYLRYSAFKPTVMEALGLLKKTSDSKEEEEKEEARDEGVKAEALSASPNSTDTESKQPLVESEDSAKRKASLRVLVVGCGNSALSEDLYKDGFINSVSIDYSEVVIGQMQKVYKKSIPDLRFETMDVRDMKFAKDTFFDVIFDKGTLDTLLCGGEDTARNARMMLFHIHKVMKAGSVFFIITYGTPDTRLHYLQSSRFKWNIKHSQIGKRYIYTMTKR